MASITNESNGRRTIQFVGADGKRRSIRLGKVSKRVADAVKLHVEDLVACHRTGQPIPLATERWLEHASDQLHDRISAVGLTSPRVRRTLAAFIDDYIASRTDAKPGTKTVWSQSRRRLVEHFGGDCVMRSVTAADVSTFRQRLAESGLAEATIRRTLGHGKQFFGAAMKINVCAANPFVGIPCAVGANPDRAAFVSRESIQKLLEHCPNDDWRRLIVLARFGGLRTPSESLLLRWGDIDVARGRMRVTSPKTARHEDGGERWVPLFPELLPHLGDHARPRDAETHDFVIATYRGSAINLRTRLLKIMKRAGVEPWPKLWQNMRASRETELVESFPDHVVSAWIGHSVAIARKHYLQVTDAHFRLAAGMSQPSTPSDTAGDQHPSAVQIPVQCPPESAGKASQRRVVEPASPAQNGDLQTASTGCDQPTLWEVTPRGFEPRLPG